MVRLLLLALLLPAVPANAAELIGLWLTQDRDGVIAMSACDGGICADIVGFLLDHPADPTPVDYRGVSQCHLRLISDARQVQPNLWKGHILDPRNGSSFGVELHLDRNGNIALRGFLGIPLLGQTQIWTHFPGTVPNDCRLAAGITVPRTLPSLPERGE